MACTTNSGLPGTAIPATGSGKGSDSVGFSRGGIKYDSPFLDMTSSWLPDDIKKLFPIIASYVFGDAFTSHCITKLAEYPITKFRYNDNTKSSLKEDNTVAFWENMMERKIDLARVLKQSGMDYYAYGTSIASMHYPFQRRLKCSKCSSEFNVASLKNVKFSKYKYTAKCTKCNHIGEMKSKDMPTKDIDGIRVVLWDLMNIDIKYNSITGESFYYYKVPNGISNMIRSGDLDIINGTRLEIIDAVKANKKIKLKSDNVFVLKRPGAQYIKPMNRGWGTPAMLAVLKDVFHARVLKKGNEMIAFDHIVPLRILFPQGTGDVSPHLQTNLSGWKTKIESEILKWKKDPNYISIMPMPLGQSSFGGDARMLMVTQEIKASEDNIITGLGVIPEIIRGGASWSGSNVSLRVVENTFLNHRTSMQSLITFISDKVASYFNKTKVNIDMTEFKMADDLEKKRLILNVSQGRASDSMVSRDTMARELGFDYEAEYEKIQSELKDTVEMRIKEREGEAEAQGAGAVIDALYQADAEMENTSRKETISAEKQQKHDMEMDQSKEESREYVQEDAYKLSNGKEVDLPTLIMILTQRFARLKNSNPEEFKLRMLAMKNSTPNMYNEVFANLKEMNLIEADTMPNLDIAQKYTPGQIPSNAQGETTADSPPTPVESDGPVPTRVPEANVAMPKKLPEVNAPRGNGASI